MDPLRIFDALTGGISATSDILQGLNHAISTASKIKDAPDLANSTVRDVTMMRLNMQRFQQLLKNSQTLTGGRVNYISLDDVQNSFTDCVTSLDELESVLQPLASPGLKGLAMSERLEWVMNDKRVNLLSRRVHDGQSSLGLMLTILQHESIIEVHNAITSLSEVCERIAINVAHLNRKSGMLFGADYYSNNYNGKDEVDDASTIRPTVLPQPRPDSVVVPANEVLDLDTDENDDDDSLEAVAPPRFAFEHALETSRPYRKTPHWNSSRISLQSSIFNSEAWSRLSKVSGLSLGDVSIISVVALPLCCTDISNSKHYSFGQRIPEKMDMQGMDAVIQGYSQPKIPSSRRSILPSPPHSPSTPVKAGVAKMLKAMKKTFEQDTSRTRLAAEKLQEIVIEEPTFPNNLSLSQLSTLTFQESRWHFCHGEGNLTCYGAVDKFRTELDMKNIRRCQLLSAAANDYLDSFSCTTCHMSLATIVRTKKMDWSLFELWCGSKTCLGGQSFLLPCPCFSKIQRLGLPQEKYFGIRIRPTVLVNCARCYSICPACSGIAKYYDPQDCDSKDEINTDETPRPLPPRTWDPQTAGGKLYQDQEHVLIMQQYLVRRVEEMSSETKKNRRIQNNVIEFLMDRYLGSSSQGNAYRSDVSEFERRLKDLEGGHEVLTGPDGELRVLERRQMILIRRAEMLPSWREMNFWRNDNEMVWSREVENMRVQFQSYEEELDEIAKKNVLTATAPVNVVEDVINHVVNRL